MERLFQMTRKYNPAIRSAGVLFMYLALSFNAPLFAQPGGGGGLVISNFYSDKLERIDLLHNPSLKIRTFLLSGTNIAQETFLFEKFQKENGKPVINSPAYGFGLPSPMEPGVDAYPHRKSDQRMLIFFRKDTMIVDFIGIMGEN